MTDIPIYESKNENKTFDELMHEKVLKQNILNKQEKEKYSQFLSQTDTKIILEKINKLDNNEELLPFYMSVVNPLYIKQQLLDYELTHVRYTKEELINKFGVYDDMKEINNEKLILNVLNTYKCPYIDDNTWVITKRRNTLRINNTFIENYKYLVTEYLEKIMELLDPLYKDDIDYDFDNKVDNCTRRVVYVMYNLK